MYIMQFSSRTSRCNIIFLHLVGCCWIRWAKKRSKRLPGAGGVYFVGSNLRGTMLISGLKIPAWRSLVLPSPVSWNISSPFFCENTVKCLPWLFQTTNTIRGIQVSLCPFWNSKKIRKSQKKLNPTIVDIDIETTVRRAYHPRGCCDHNENTEQNIPPCRNIHLFGIISWKSWDSGGHF